MYDIYGMSAAHRDLIFMVLPIDSNPSALVGKTAVQQRTLHQRFHLEMDTELKVSLLDAKQEGSIYPALGR